MRLLLRDPAEARRIGDNARRVALQRFHIGRFVEDWKDALESVAG
jgi:glycosyltransferase involved in cell wall biosynthesis